MTVGNFIEILGTDNNDTLTGFDLEIVYGDSDSDFLAAEATEDSNTKAITVLVGGTGRNFYSVRNNATAVIFENSGSTDNTLYTTVLGSGIDSTTEDFIIADIDNRHLYFGNKNIERYVFLVDWQQSENRIENFNFVNGSLSYEDFASSYQELSGYLGNLSWAEVAERGEIELNKLGLTTDESDELITRIVARASELEPSGNNSTNPLPEGQEVGNFRELIGTEETDVFESFDREIIYGLDNNDVLTTNYGHLASGRTTSFLVGGSGNNSYSVAENSTAIIIENNQSKEDTLTLNKVALDISNEDDAPIIAEIDSRHLFIGNTDFNQYAILIDWQIEANQIETFNLVEGTITYASFVNNFRNSNGYRGNFTWSELEAQGLINLDRLDLEATSIDDSLNIIIERSLFLGGSEDNNNNNNNNNLPLGNFLELLGTDGDDSISSADLQIMYALAGDDVLNSYPNFGGGSLPNGGETTILVGGSGKNDYQIRNNSTAIVIENNNSDDNILWTTIGIGDPTGIGLEKTTSFFTEIDNRHLYLGDTESNQYAILIDWQTEANQIETFDLVERTISYAEFANSFRDSEGYRGNVNWDELTTIDFERLGLETASLDNTFAQINNRAIELESNDLETIKLFRFRNTTIDTGTYVFVAEAEKNAIQTNESLNNSFVLEGITSEGAINPAFTASLEPGANLLPFYRLSSIANPGTFLYVSTEEYSTIFAEDSPQQNQWSKQGLDTEGKDIPEFYLHGVGAETGLEFHRFQNRANGTFLFAAPTETEIINSDPNLSNTFIDQGIAFNALL